MIIEELEELIDKVRCVSKYKIPRLLPLYLNVSLNDLRLIVNIFLDKCIKIYKNNNNKDAVGLDNNLNKYVIDCFLRVIKERRPCHLTNEKFGCYSALSELKCEDCCFFHKNSKFLYKVLYQLKIQIKLQLNKKDDEQEKE